MDAASGGAGGGSTEMITKGGTNQLHGALSEYSNNSALQATAFFVNSIGGTETQVGGQPVGRRGWRSDLDPQGFQRQNRLFFLFAMRAYIPAAPPHCLARRDRGGRQGISRTSSL